MSSLLFVVLFLLISMVTIFFTQSIKVWTVVFFVFLFGVKSIFYISPITFWVISIFYLMVIILGNISLIRDLLIGKLIFPMFKKAVPTISSTEEIALNAGDTWYEKDIFQGTPDFDKLHNINVVKLTDEEQSFLDNEVVELCSMIDDWKVLHVDYDLSEEVWNYLREKKFFGLVISKEYGGKGFSATAHSAIVMKVGSRSITAGVTVMVPNSLGPGELISHYGTQEQKDKYLANLASGAEIPCFALTGPTAGSDATSIPDNGVVCMGEYDGKSVLGIKLTNVHKRYITLAPVATLVGLAFKLYDPDKLLTVGSEGITCVLLPHDHPGLQIGKRALPMGQVFMNGTIDIEESFIPIDWIIGGVEMAGLGWKMLVECLSIGRAISLPACGTASAIMATVLTTAYSTIREQFKLPIYKFEGIEEKLAYMSGVAYLSNATRLLTVSAIDNGISPSVSSAITKYHLTEMGRSTFEAALDVHAGRGIIIGPNNYIASGYLGNPISITVEGANILTRNLLIFGQGALRCHPYLRAEYESLSKQNGIHQFMNALFGHIGYSIRVRVRAIFHSFTRGIFANGRKSSKFHIYYKKISLFSDMFAAVSDGILLLLGADIKRHERISARLGDCLSYLYMSCAVLKFYEDSGKLKDHELFVEWSLEYALYQAQNALITMCNNLLITKVIRHILFPFGRIVYGPTDQLEHKLVSQVMKDCKVRKYFTNITSVSQDKDDVVGRVEYLFQRLLDLEPVKSKIVHAMKTKKLPKGSIQSSIEQALQLEVITKGEANDLTDAYKMIYEVIQTDVFEPFEFGKKNAHPTWC